MVQANRFKQRLKIIRIFLPLQKVTREHRRGNLLQIKENAYTPIGNSGHSWN